MHNYRIALILPCAVVIAACATRSYKYQDADFDSLRQRAEIQTEGPLRVSAAVLGSEETRAIFGLNLYSQGIQPVWLQIENTGESLARYAPVSTDPDYFAPLEIAYKNRGGLSAEAREQVNQRFDQLAMRRYVYPGEVQSGFVFTHLDVGAKVFSVDVSTRNQYRSFMFALRVPGFEADYSRVDLGSIYADGDLHSYDTDHLQQALRDLPCCSTRGRQSTSGEPINLVLVGNNLELLIALLRSGWHETSVADASALAAEFYFGRPQDAVFRYESPGGEGFFELRFWLAPIKVGDQSVWVGQARHFFNWIGIVERFDADVDTARMFAVQKFLYGQAIQSIAWLSGTAVVPATSFWDQLVNTPYFTDGYRVVLWLSGEPSSVLDVQVLDWDSPPRMVP